MQKVSVTLLPKQAEILIEQLVQNLDFEAKYRLVQKLQREMRRARWEPLVLKMRRRFASKPLSSRQIRQVCEQVRQERFERAGRR